VPAVVITWFLGFLHHMFVVTELSMRDLKCSLHCCRGFEFSEV